MTIELITKEEYAKLVEIQKKHPLLTYKNKGYDTPDQTKWSDKDHEAFKDAIIIISKSIKGYNKFNHFTIATAKGKEGKIGLRFQYDYQADLTSEERSKTNLGSFTGVGYILLDELFNGFKD